MAKNAWGMTPEEMQAEREKRLSGDHSCYGGQWKIHAAHDYEVRVQNWLGGGNAHLRCPGKTAETVLGGSR